MQAEAECIFLGIPATQSYHLCPAPMFWPDLTGATVKQQTIKKTGSPKTAGRMIIKAKLN